MAFFARLALLLLSFPGWAAPAVAQPAAGGAASLDGRWNLLLKTPQGDFPTAVEFVVSDRRRVTASVLSPSGSFTISNASGTLDGERLKLSAKSSFGKLRVSATIRGGRLSGHWGPAGLISGLFFRGELSGTRDAAYSRKPPAEVYDKLWTTLERNFYALDYNGVDTAALRERYRPQVAATRTDGEFQALVRQMLSEFRTSHLDMFVMPPPTADAQPADGDPASRTHGISWRQISPGIGYLRIASFEDGAEVMARVDRAFAELGSNPALIVDIRENGGGSLSAAMRTGDYIFAQQRPVGYFAGRAGLTRHNVRSMDELRASSLPIFTGYSSGELAREMHSAGAVMLATGARARQAFSGKLVLLVDEYCFSACEAFASVAKETGAATLVGRRTAGAMLAAFPIDVDGGWTLLLPVWDFRTPGGARVEGKGVEPHVAVRRSDRTDADLKAALRLVRQGAGSR